MIENFEKYNEKFYDKPCILALILNNQKSLEKIFEKKTCEKIILQIKNSENILWFGKTNNSKFRTQDLCLSQKTDNSLQETIAKLIKGKIKLDDYNEYKKLRRKITDWLTKNTTFYACLCSKFKKKDAELIKKELIIKYQPPLNIRYNEKVFNSFFEKL